MSITRTHFLAAVLLFSCLTHNALAQDVTQSALSSGHPLLGVWRIDLQGGCFEEYTLRVDGTKLSESGQERNESIFELSAMPSVNGFYRWADKITKSNGKPDCGGALTEMGHVAVNFIRLHASGSKFLLCAAEDLSSCFAEFRRKPRDLVLNVPGPTSMQRAGCREWVTMADASVIRGNHGGLLAAV